MSFAFNVFSEIDPLRTVLVHRPGEELLSLSPHNLERLLFDDIPYLEVAQDEHDAFTRMLAGEGVEVRYLIDLAVEALEADADARSAFIRRYLDESGVFGESIKELASAHLHSISDTRALVERCIAGIRLQDIDLDAVDSRSLADADSIDHCRRSGIVVDPIPNLYFTRDTFSVIGHGVSLNSMRTKTRRRESLFADTIFASHPAYKDAARFYESKEDASIEGGDILVLSRDTLAIGISERTQAAAIDKLAKRLLLSDDAQSFKRILAFMLPHRRAFMHLDTVFTQADRDIFTVHPGILGMLEVYEIRRGATGALSISRLEDSLDAILARGLGLDAVRLIKCGGDDPISADREQWNDGANTLAVRPGTVFVYQRNRVTNEILCKAGLNLLEIPSSELSRGRGGPHCMSMAFWRDSAQD